MPKVSMDQRIKEQLGALDRGFRSQLRNAKSVSEVYALANRSRRSDSPRNVPAEFLDPFFQWHKAKVVEITSGSSGSALVAGPGNCSDFQLGSMAEHFDKVVLVDVDGEAPELAREGLPAKLREKVRIEVCDASLYAGRLIARAEKAIRRAVSGDAAAEAARGILCAPPANSDVTPMPFEDGSFGFVLSDDVVPNIFPLPTVWLDEMLKKKFGEDCGISNGGQIPPIQVGAAGVHLIDAFRVLAPGGLLAASASVAYVTVAVTSGSESIVYCRNAEDGGLVLLSAPRLGLITGSHFGLKQLAATLSTRVDFSSKSFDTHLLRLAETQPGTQLGIGETGTYVAALHEFMVLQKNS